MDTLALAGGWSGVDEAPDAVLDAGPTLPDTETPPISAPDESAPSSNDGAPEAMMPRSLKDYNYFKDMREALANLHAEDGTVA